MLPVGLWLDCIVLELLVVVELLGVEELIGHELYYVRVLEVLFVEQLHPLYHWLRSDYKKFRAAFHWQLVEKLIPFLQKFQNAQLVIAVDVGDEDDSGLQEGTVD